VEAKRRDSGTPPRYHPRSGHLPSPSPGLHSDMRGGQRTEFGARCWSSRCTGRALGEVPVPPWLWPWPALCLACPAALRLPCLAVPSAFCVLLAVAALLVSSPPTLRMLPPSLPTPRVLRSVSHPFPFHRQLCNSSSHNHTPRI
jgi:hypothetical protein